jgi:WG containing repeat
MKSLYTKIFIGGLLIVNTLILVQHLTNETKADTAILFVIKENEKCGYINSTGKLAIRPCFKAAGEFEGGLARVMKDSLWGFINLQGKFAIAPQYTIAKDFSEGLAEVWIGDKHFYIDTLGKIVFETSFKNTGKFCDGLSKVYSNEGFTKGFMDKKGKLVIPVQYLYAENFSEGLTNVSEEFLDASGKSVIESKEYTIIKGFSEGVAVVALKDGTPAFINKKGKVVIRLDNMNISSAYSFSDGLAVVNDAGIDHKSGYINKNGKLLIPCRYAEANGFSEGLASARNELNGLWGFINKRGDWVIKQRFTQVPSEGFKNGLALIKENDKWGYINKKGEFIWQEK